MKLRLFHSFLTAIWIDGKWNEYETHRLYKRNSNQAIQYSSVKIEYIATHIQSQRIDSQAYERCSRRSCITIHVTVWFCCRRVYWCVQLNSTHRNFQSATPLLHTNNIQNTSIVSKEFSEVLRPAKFVFLPFSLQFIYFPPNEKKTIRTKLSAIPFQLSNNKETKNWIRLWLVWKAIPMFNSKNQVLLVCLAKSTI